MLRSLILVVVALVLAACEWSTDGCADPHGRFAAELTETDGNCGELDDFVMTLPLEASGMWEGCSVTNDDEGACSVRSRVRCADGLSYDFELQSAPGGDLRGEVTLRDDWLGCESTYEVDGEGW